MEKESWQLFPNYHRRLEAREPDLEAFVAELRLGEPVSVTLEGLHWGPGAGDILAGIPPAMDLRFLCIRGTLVGDAGLRTLAQAPVLPVVRTLCLERCGLTDAGIPDLFNSQPLLNLNTLCLCNREGIPAGTLNHLTDRTALTLANSTALPNLQELNLWNTGVGDLGWEAIANAPTLAKLQSAYAWGTRLTAECANKIKTASHERFIAVAPSDPPLPKCWFHTDYDERTISWTEDY